MIKTLIGSFDHTDDADRAYRNLLRAGFLDADLNLIVNNAPEEAPVGTRTVVKTEGDGTATGAVAGGVLGGAAGLAASLMGLAIPGIGPILAAGPIVAALAGAGAGAVAGGLIGSLTDLGVEKDEAELYAESVRRGGSLVTVRADESRADEATAILRESGAIDITRRAEEWKSAGWSGYDPDAVPLTRSEIERERERYRVPDAERLVPGRAEGAAQRDFQRMP
jgi:uncharacterized membrane protein